MSWNLVERNPEFAGNAPEPICILVDMREEHLDVGIDAVFTILEILSWRFRL
jgi:hypothetical protein